MKLFNVCEVVPVGLDDVNVMSPSRGWIIVLECDGIYYGWSDHRGLKLPIGKWIKFKGNDRSVLVSIALAGNVQSYRNGFHAVFSRWNGEIECGIENYHLDCAQKRARSWAKLKHRKNMKLGQIKVDFRGVTHVGEMLLGDSGADYRGCVCQQIRINEN